MQELGKQLRHLAESDPDKLSQVLNQLSEEEAMSILYDWEGIWARDNQIVNDDWSESAIIFCAGRGYGKSRVICEYLRKKAKNPLNNFALVGATNRDTVDILVLGESGIMGVCPPDERPEYEPSKSRIVFPSGAIANLMSGETPERARGHNRTHIIADELGSWPDVDMVHQLMLSLRKGESRFVGATTPRATETILYFYRNAVFNDDPPQEGKWCRMITGSTYENLHNLSKTFRDTIVTTYEGTRLGSQELLGQLLLDAEGALWTTEIIANQTLQRGQQVPKLERCAIGVDPSVSTGKHSDLTGIVVCGLGEDGFGYVLEDQTGKYTPEGWANKVVQLYDHYRQFAPTSIAVERNMGGNLVADTLYRVRPLLPVDDVFSTKSKISRAQPIALLYEQGKVFHAKSFLELEQEMTGYEGKSRDKSPDRLDALVFAATTIMPTKNRVTKGFELFV